MSSKVDERTHCQDGRTHRWVADPPLYCIYCDLMFAKVFNILEKDMSSEIRRRNSFRRIDDIHREPDPQEIGTVSYYEIKVKAKKISKDIYAYQLHINDILVSTATSPKIHQLKLL